MENEITSRGIDEEYWCAVKHALHLEGHLEENIANASRYDPDAVPYLAKTLDTVRHIRQSLVRKVLGVDKKGDTTIQCVRCLADLESTSKPQKTKYLNTTAEKSVMLHTYPVIKKSAEGENMDAKTFGIITGSQFIGYGVKEGVERFVPAGSTAGIDNKVLADVGIGVVASLGALFGDKIGIGDNEKIILAVIGSQRIADRVVQLVTGKAAAPTAALPPAPAPAFALPPRAVPIETVSVD